jgi:hypothetical protein
MRIVKQLCMPMLLGNQTMAVETVVAAVQHIIVTTTLFIANCLHGSAQGTLAHHSMCHSQMCMHQRSATCPERTQHTSSSSSSSSSFLCSCLPSGAALQAAALPNPIAHACAQVDPKRQKLLGLKTKDGKMATDEAAIADLAIKPNTKVHHHAQRTLQRCVAAGSAAIPPSVAQQLACLQRFSAVPAWQSAMSCAGTAGLQLQHAVHCASE